MTSERALVAHLMRRAGFGATMAELNDLTRDKSYEEIVEDLLNPNRFSGLDQSLIDRYYAGETVAIYVGKWMFRMINSPRPLEEKMALFLHQIFPVAWGKGEHGPSIYSEIDMFRRVGMTDIRTILMELSRDPAMIFWLDNNENHRDEINENFGRELLELFSMGIGNYTEDDIKSASRAFTGWTFTQPLSLYPVGHHQTKFKFTPEDHDYESKTFLGQSGNFNGEDIIDIIVKQTATARFISRHLYNFFVEDEVPVPSWKTIPPKNEDAITRLSKIFMETGGQMTPVLRYLFNSDFFKSSTTFKKVKSPVELIVGTLKHTGEFNVPVPGIDRFAVTTINGSLIEGPMPIMGQRLLNPPTVEGWHTGREWINSGTLSERIRFVESQLGDSSKPVIKAMIEQIKTVDQNPAQMVKQCTEILGEIYISNETYNSLLQYAEELVQINDENKNGSVGIHNLLLMTASSVDYQFA